MLIGRLTSSILPSLLFSFKPGTPSHETDRLRSYLSFLWIMHRLNLSVITRGKRAPRNRAPLDYWRRKEEHHSPLRHDIKRDSGRSIFRSFDSVGECQLLEGRAKRWLKLSPSRTSSNTLFPIPFAYNSTWRDIFKTSSSFFHRTK